MKKKLIALLLLLVMAVCIFPASAFAVSPCSVTGSIDDRSAADGFFYLMIYNKEYKIQKGTLLYNDGGEAYKTENKTAQLKLTELSIDFDENDINPGGVDGYFGDGTESATKAFQKYWNNDLAYWYAAGTVDVDGLIGNETWSAFTYHVRPY